MDRTMLAIAESSLSKPSISIFELHSFRKRKALTSEVTLSKEFISMSFSIDSKYLAVQSSEPDYTLHYFAWEKGKAIATISSVPNGYNGKLKQISINPYDSTEICVIGENLIRIFRYAEGVLRPLRVNLPSKDYRCHAWIDSSSIVLGTSEGYIYLITDGNLHQSILFGNGLAVESLVATNKGFVAGGQSGNIIIYGLVYVGNKLETTEVKRKLVLPESENVVIQTMSVSSSQGDLLFETNKSQIYKISLEIPDSSKAEEEAKFESITDSFHFAPVKGMDICGRKPLLVTCSSDKSIRIWNYTQNYCEQVKYFQEEVSSIALHPSGLYVLAGFTDKLRLMNILMDDIRTFREFPIRSCQECRFSNGGHLFAATHGNMIQIFSVWTFDCIGLLKGHNGRVRSLYFTPDDSILVSAGSDGAVYTWNMRELKRENEHILKTCSYSSAVCSPNGKTVYAVGIDKMLKEITESSVTREVESNSILTQVALSHSGRMMFVGTTSGSIRAMKYPLSDVSDFQEHEAHSSAITKFRVSFDDQYLFSCAEDGSVYIYKIADKEDHALKRDKLLVFSDEILITKSDLEEKTVLMGELQRSLEELKLEHEYQLRLKDMNFNEKLKEITDKYSQEIEGLKISTSVLRTEKDREDVRHQEELQNLKANQIQEVHEVETKYNQRLMEEYEKFQREQEKSNEVQEVWQKQMRAFEEDSQKQLAETQANAETHLNQKGLEINKLREQSLEQIKELEEMSKQNDEDIDTECEALVNRYEKKVKAEREEGARFKGENGIMRKKFNTLNKDIEENKAEISRMAENEKRLQNVIAGFEKDIQNLRREMAERDEHIQDKERKVYDLKKRNQELEKFKFVLDFRIKELKEQVEPKENEIEEMSNQIQEINLELEKLCKQKHHLEETIENLKNALSSKKQNYMKEHIQAHNLSRQIKYFRTDLQDAISFFQDPILLKKSVSNIWEKYCSKADNLKNAKLEPQLKAEYTRQQDTLRRQIQKLRSESESHNTAFKADNVAAVMKNRQLIQEINRLRGIGKVKIALKKSTIEASNEPLTLPEIQPKVSTTV